MGEPLVTRLIKVNKHVTDGGDADIKRENSRGCGSVYNRPKDLEITLVQTCTQGTEGVLGLTSRWVKAEAAQLRSRLRSPWKGLSRRKGSCSRSGDLFAGNVPRDLCGTQNQCNEPGLRKQSKVQRESLGMVKGIILGGKSQV
ncbi:hypothetical protein CB1_001389007 [Camelus ferus]|nr:hypothetical protein CB1_001904002 [Camelus ferus]EPY76794.1 hypothetical protein CB1_001389007 [Camelus ferus]